MPIEEIKTKFAKNLKTIMQEHQKTQGDLVKDLNFRQATVSDWLNGKKYPRMDKIEKLANYFGISINDLLMQTPTHISITLTAKEEKHIMKYRKLTNESQNAIDSHIDFILYQQAEELRAKKKGYVQLLKIKKKEGINHALKFRCNKRNKT